MAKIYKIKISEEENENNSITIIANENKTKQLMEVFPQYKEEIKFNK